VTTTNQDFKRVFAGILGKPCWDVKPGVGSFLTLEFGKPHLVIREPVAARKRVSVKVREHLAHRQVDARGEWHLWIYCCDWEVRCKGKRVGNSSTRLGIRRAAAFLYGQKLIRFSISPRKVQSIFVFDLGATLKTFPCDKTSEQWMVFEPSQKVLVLRADGQYKHARSDRPHDEGAWETI
jgi:hypothetical protein